MDTHLLSTLFYTTLKQINNEALAFFIFAWNLLLIAFDIPFVKSSMIKIDENTFKDLWYHTIPSQDSKYEYNEEISAAFLKKMKQLYKSHK
jgi:hypothetical protein